MLTVTPDVAGPALLIGLGVIVGGFTSVAIVLVETLVLWRLRWAGFWRSLGVALVANLVSSVAGLLLVFPYLTLDAPPGAGLLVLGFVVSFAASVAIEGGIFMLFKRGMAAENWRAALFANLASYLLILGVVAIWYVFG